jgi:hypothetical protein
MYKELKKFKVSDKFSFAADDLEQVYVMLQKEAACFSIAASRRKRVDHGGFYWNCTKNDFENKNGGLKEKIVEGHQFAKNRKIFLASANEKKTVY